MLDLLHAAAKQGNQRLPTSGLAHALLHLDNEGSRKYDPVAWLLKRRLQADGTWKGNPLISALNAEPSVLRSASFSAENCLMVNLIPVSDAASAFGELDCEQ